MPRTLNSQISIERVFNTLTCLRADQGPTSHHLQSQGAMGESLNKTQINSTLSEEPSSKQSPAVYTVQAMQSVT